MSLVSSAVRVAGTGELSVGAPNITGPTGVGSALTNLVGLGYTDEDGVALGKTIDREDINAWQSITPVRSVYTGLELTIAVTLIESKKSTVELWWGSAFTANAGASGEFKAELSTIPTGTEKSVVLDWQDGTIKNRLWVPRAEVTDTGDISLSKEDATGFEITFSALAPNSGAIATWFTNDAAFGA